MYFGLYVVDFQQIFLLILQLHSNFHVRNQTRMDGSINSALAHALETREGTSEEVDSVIYIYMMLI